MNNRVMIQEGYSLPFAGSFAGAKKKKKKPRGKHRRVTKKQRAAGKRLARIARACGAKWRKKSDKYRKNHSYRAFQKRVC